MKKLMIIAILLLFTNTIKAQENFEWARFSKLINQL